MNRLVLAFLFFSTSAKTQDLPLREISPGIFGYWIEPYHNKAVVIEFDRFLALAEFPHGDSISEKIIATAAARFPKKPIKYVFHTHHHDHSSMGFDAFLRRTNAMLVTGRFNYEQIKTRTSDTLALQKRVILVDSLYELKSGRQRLQLFVLKEQTYEVPTEEFNLIYMPAQNLIVSGCLFNKPLTYHEVINSRKTSLRKFLRNSGIQVNFLRPTNTTRVSNFEDICTREMFEQTFALGLDPAAFAKQLQALSIEYLESKIDSLAAEFRKIPRGYDYAVCARFLVQVKRDYNRAIIVNKTLLKLYPADPDYYYNIARCYEFKLWPIEAAAYYKRFVALTRNREEAAEVSEHIRKLEAE